MTEKLIVKICGHCNEPLHISIIEGDSPNKRRKKYHGHQNEEGSCAYKQMQIIRSRRAKKVREEGGQRRFERKA